jgi:hypothetical protein
MNVSGIRIVEKVAPIVRAHEKKEKTMEGWPDDYKCEGQMTFDEYLRKEMTSDGNDRRRNRSEIQEGRRNSGTESKNKNSCRA